MELFTHELTGELKTEARVLRELRKRTDEKNAPIEEQVLQLADQAKALMEQAKALVEQVEANEEVFYRAREAFFVQVRDELDRDTEDCRLRFEDETGKAFVERTEEEGCANPDCRSCNPTTH